MSLQTGAFAPASRVISRSEAPANASGASSSAAASATRSMSRFASAWGRWLVSASRRSCAAASVRTVRAPSEATKRSTSATLSAEDASVGVRNHVAASKRSAAARAGPPVAPPATGWPGTKRGSSTAASGRLVEATSVTTTSGAGGVEHLLHDGRSRADRNRDDDELRIRDRLAERRRRLERAARRCALEHAGVRVEAATARARAAGRQRDGRPDEPGADDGEALDRAWPLGRSFGRRGRAAVGRDLLLQHVEDRGEDRRDTALRERPGVRGDERLQQLRLALGIDPPLAGRVLVVADGGDELEPPVQQLEQPPVELGDLVPECVEVAHASCRSPASTATASRFAGGASGQTQPGS